jgi:hypothetical protein
MRLPIVRRSVASCMMVGMVAQRKAAAVIVIELEGALAF